MIGQNYKIPDTETIQLVRDAYYKEGGFADGSYLTQYNTESDESYQFRQSTATCPSFVSVTVDSMLAPILGGIESVYENPILEAFVMDADGYGSNWENLRDEFALKADLDGCQIAMLDTESEQPSSIGEMMGMRTFPKVITISPLDITYYRMLGRGKFDYFIYSSYIDENANTVYGVYKSDNGGEFYYTKSESGHTDDLSDPQPVLVPPMIYAPKGYSDDYTLPTSNYANTARLQKAYYNNDSNIVVQTNKTSHVLLSYPGQFDDANAKFTAISLLEYSEMSNKAPAYITPPDTITRLMDWGKQKEYEAYTEQNLGILYTGSMASGESKKWSDSIRQQLLRDKSKRLADFVMVLLDSFLILTNQNVDGAYKLVFPVDFESLTEDKDLENLQKWDSINIAPENMIRLKKEALINHFSTASDEDKQAIIAAEDANDDMTDEPEEEIIIEDEENT